MPRYLDAQIPGCLGAQMTTCQPRCLVAAAAAHTALADLAAAAAVQVAMNSCFHCYTAGSAACACACACAGQ